MSGTPEGDGGRGAGGAGDDGPVPGERLLRAWRSWLPFAAVIVVMLVVASVVVSLNSGQPPVQSASCPPADAWPAVSADPPAFTDNNVSVFVGGDFSTERAATASEGLLVVLGDATLGRATGGAASGGGVTEVGAVRAGSGVTPTPGTTMFAVGGSLSIPPDAAVEIGHGVRGGGNLVVGGALITRGTASGDTASVGRVTANGGVVHERAGRSAVAEFRRFGARISDQAALLAGLPATGVVTVAGRSIYLAGDGQSRRQAFSVDSRVFGRSTLIDFSGIPDDATVVVTVRGETVQFGTGKVQDGGVQVVPGPGAAGVATRTLWNFVDARSVTIAGTAPVLGSIVAPQARVVLGTPSQGRLYVGGDLLLEGRSTPHRNYGWAGTAAFACQPSRENVQ